MISMQNKKSFFKALLVLSTVLPTIILMSPAPILAQTTVAGRALMDRPAIDRFYKAQEGKPYWTRNGGLSSEGEDLVEAVEQSWTHGLNPDRYHLARIAELEKSDNEAARQNLETLLSDAYARYVHDLTGMRVSPTSLGMDTPGWVRPMKASGAFELLEQKRDVDAALAVIAPQGGTYAKLRQELIKLSDDAPPDYEAALPINTKRGLKPGLRDKDIPKVRARLGVSSRRENADLYDDSLAGAVIRFQKENGLVADGVIGAKTLQYMNRTQADKIKQLALNLERLRWVPAQKPERFIVVNVPTATLWALDRGRVAIDMPVIVGRKDRPTKSFITEITGVRFNPTWTVPPTIKNEDILPKLQENAAYVMDTGMDLVKVEGETRTVIDPLQVDWKDMTREDMKSIRMVQGAGSNNPLGNIRILMPNRFDIYLHDTNHPEYFNKPDRMISSGCMRMKDPEAVAAFILDEQPDWSEADMNALLASGRTRDVLVAERIPVYVLYYTAWVGEDGRVAYGEDIYGEDARLFRALSALDGIAIFSQNKS